MSIYKRYLDKTKCMYFMIKDEKNFKKNVKTTEKASSLIKSKFNSAFLYNKRYLNTKENVLCTSNIDWFSL